MPPLARFPNEPKLDFQKLRPVTQSYEKIAVIGNGASDLNLTISTVKKDFV